MQQDSKDIRQEYAVGFCSLREALQQHTAFCLFNDFDQIRQTNLIEVQCLNCKKTMKVTYDRLAFDLFCQDCKDTVANADIMQALQNRLQHIRQRLLKL